MTNEYWEVWDIAAMIGCFVRGDEIGSP
jgi:hypothetical protein